MTVLVGNLTPFTIWKINGGLIGACRTVEDATGLIRDLKVSFPGNEYQVMGPGQGDELEVYHDSRDGIAGFECRGCDFSYPADAATRHCGGCGEPLTVKTSAAPSVTLTGNPREGGAT